MSEYTKEPWVGMVNGKYNSNHDWEAINDELSSTISAPIMAKSEVVALVVGEWNGDGEEVNANARRLGACVNACAGIATESLERVKDELTPVFELLMQATNERNELLAELKYLNLMASQIHGEDVVGWNDLTVAGIRADKLIDKIESPHNVTPSAETE
jgi:hypothetical protein